MKCVVIFNSFYQDCLILNPINLGIAKYYNSQLLLVLRLWSQWKWIVKASVYESNLCGTPLQEHRHRQTFSLDMSDLQWTSNTTKRIKLPNLQTSSWNRTQTLRGPPLESKMSRSIEVAVETEWNRIIRCSKHLYLLGLHSLCTRNKHLDNL